MGITTTLAALPLTGMVIALVILARAYSRLKSKHAQLSKAYATERCTFSKIGDFHLTNG